MIVTKRGRPIPITDEQVRRIREWKRLKQLADEMGLPMKTVHRIRSGYRYRKVSP